MNPHAVALVGYLLLVVAALGALGTGYLLATLILYVLGKD